MTELPFAGRIEEYDLVKPIGAGSTGSVYLAIDTVLAREVAIKVITESPGIATRRQFIKTARAAARLQHSNIASVYRAGEIEGHPYLVAELVRGQSLAELARPLPWRRVVEIGVGLARGLAAAHRNGVIHRDIKPANVVMADDGTPKLLDFGLAVLLEHREVGLAGTPDYIAPELWRAEPASARSDIYSLGVVLYELACGRRPFADVGDGELGAAIRERDPAPLADRAPELDTETARALAAVIDRCIARDPARRPASADALRAGLEELERGGTVAAPAGNPYRGLLPFEAEHRAMFFGRSLELGTAIDRLRHETMLVIVGDSGVGKSSVCRAGIVPAVVEGALADGRAWSCVTVLPGRRPAEAITQALRAVCGPDPGDDDPQALAHAVSRALGGDRGLLVFVDQLEELATVADPAEAERAIALIVALADRSRGVRVVTTLRADFVGRIAAQLGDHFERALFLLRPLGPERIREVATGPARAAGIRFESEALVDELVAASSRGTELPLLQFALAELWEARDREHDVFTVAAFRAMGGVSGALARHADAVIGALPTGDRRAARELLVALVTADGTRARREPAALVGDRDGAKSALAALVRARLVALREDDRGTTIELAHEALIRGWPALAAWLREDAGIEAARERLRAAAAEWARLGRAGDALWGRRQLADVANVAADSLEAAPRAFLEASRRRGHRRRVRDVIAVVAAVTVAIGGYAIVDGRHRAKVAERVDSRLASARAALADAGLRTTEAAAARAAATARFELRDRAGGETAWRTVARADARVAALLADAAQTAEIALAEDPARDDVRAVLGDVLLARSLEAERAGRAAEHRELAERLELYDASGERRRVLAQPATVRLATAPAGVTVTLRRHVEDEHGRLVASAPAGAGTTPFAIELPAGSYLATLAGGGEPIVYPFVAVRGARLDLDIGIPRDPIPAGYAFVAAGPLLFGSSADDESRLGFYDTVPLHRTTTRDFLIARHEVTFADWLAFVDTLAPAEREARLPAVAPRVAGGGLLRVAREADRWTLHLRPAEQTLAAAAGEPVRYEGRSERAAQDWLRFPVTGISADDALAYTRWLAETRLPGARLCSEREWERATRGADGREYPHGRTLAATDANFDETHAKGPRAMGPSEAGSHPASTSPHGLLDASGNAFEWTTGTLGDGDFVVRGGSYYHDRKTARLSNRAVSVSSLRDATVGMRVCADVR